ncbi:uncharacterized protein LOC123211864 isoform X1 [Mangifera indica]|uniref:uncharacterized protein LOC123211864 isoform X1 n=1 Tax=Mangifera indica TaxID=29780 RepID=UPI001CFAA50E|nr:uncharacterized protein LOC123211864 isoform X1 [Mangifera indica]
MACTMRLTKPMRASSHVHISSSMPIHSYQVLIFNTRNSRKEFNKQSVLLGQQNLIPVPKSSQPNDSVVPSEDDENGVSLGTMKLPPNTDLQHFDSLLFQWANSLCQGANLPLPMPLKVDKIPGGARLGFITVGDGQTEVLVYIDCLVFPATSSSGPIFRAIRNGPLKDKPPPGEPRIMRSLLQALQKSVEIARV